MVALLEAYSVRQTLTNVWVALYREPPDGKRFLDELNHIVPWVDPVATI